MSSTNWELPATLRTWDTRAVGDYYKRMSALYMGWWLSSQRRSDALQEEVNKLVVELDLREGPEFCAGCTQKLMKTVTLTCDCGQEFTTHDSKRKYCCTKHQVKYRQQRYRDRKAAELGRAQNE